MSSKLVANQKRAFTVAQPASPPCNELRWILVCCTSCAVPPVVFLVVTAAYVFGSGRPLDAVFAFTVVRFPSNCILSHLVLHRWNTSIPVVPWIRFLISLRIVIVPALCKATWSYLCWQQQARSTRVQANEHCSIRTGNCLQHRYQCFTHVVQQTQRMMRACYTLQVSLFNTLRFPLVVLPKALRGTSGLLHASFAVSLAYCYFHSVSLKAPGRFAAHPLIHGDA